MSTSELPDDLKFFEVGYRRGFIAAREAAARLIRESLISTTGQWSPQVAIEAILALQPDAPRPLPRGCLGHLKGQDAQQPVGGGAR